MSDTTARAWPGANTPVANRDIRRVVAADAPDRHVARLSTMGQLYLRHDPTHELPFIVETESGYVVARFARDGDLAGFIGKDGTLPADFARQIKDAP